MDSPARFAPLPHTYPFRFVDVVREAPTLALDADPGSRASSWRGTAVARVTGNGRAAAQGSWASPLLLAEAIAQTALLLEGGDAESARRGYLAGIDGFEIVRAPFAGETLTISVALAARFGAIVKFDGEVCADDQTIARGSVLVRRGDRPEAIGGT